MKLVRLDLKDADHPDGVAYINPFYVASVSRHTDGDVRVFMHTPSDSFFRVRTGVSATVEAVNKGYE